MVVTLLLISCGSKSTKKNKQIEISDIAIVDSIFSDCTQYKSFVRETYNGKNGHIIIGITNFSENISEKEVTHVAIGSFKGRIFKLIDLGDTWTIDDSNEITFSDISITVEHSEIASINNKDYLFLLTTESCGGSACSTFDNCGFYLIDTDNLELTSIVYFRENGVLESKAYEPYYGNDTKFIFLHNKVNKFHSQSHE